MSLNRSRKILLLWAAGPLLLFLLGLWLVPRAEGAELVQRFSGENSQETVEFEVTAPWIIDWWVNSDFPQMLGMQVSLIDARRGTHEGYVLKTKYAGNGVRLFEQSGTFRLQIDATMARWVIKIEELSREEAELYTPVTESP